MAQRVALRFHTYRTHGSILRFSGFFSPPDNRVATGFIGINGVCGENESVPEPWSPIQGAFPLHAQEEAPEERCILKMNEQASAVHLNMISDRNEDITAKLRNQHQRLGEKEKDGSYFLSSLSCI